MKLWNISSLATRDATVHGLIEKKGLMISQDLMSVRQLKSQQVIQVNRSSDELSKRNSHHSTFVLK